MDVDPPLKGGTRPSRGGTPPGSRVATTIGLRSPRKRQDTVHSIPSVAGIIGPAVVTEIRVARGEHLLRSRLGAAYPSGYSYNPARSPSPYQRRGDEAVTSSSPVCAAGFSSGWLEPPDENGGVLGGDDAGGLFIGDGKAADWPADVEGRRLGLEAERPGGDPLAVHEGPQLVGPADRQSREPVRQQIPPAIGQDGRPGGGRTLRRPQLDGRGGRVGEGGQCRPLQVIVGHGGLHPVEPMVLA